MAKIEEKNPLDNLMHKYEANKKRINTIVTVVLVATIGGLVYTEMVRKPKVEKAATTIAWAQRMLEVDSFNLALNGNAEHPGFLSVKKKYSGTPTANLCNHYIGVCYLQMGDFDNAIKYLEDFDGKGTQLSYAAWGALGDAYMEKGNTEKGIQYYEKAAGNKDDKVFTPMFLYRLAVAYEISNNTEKAQEAYKRIKADFPQSQVAQDIDRHLARVGIID
ncbi:MAG: tetratricopeptide repeat protein [Taibaiella sp.]|nr:tetratricopeptide repeat protein [Taibaiella sp.]